MSDTPPEQQRSGQPRTPPPAPSRRPSLQSSGASHDHGSQPSEPGRDPTRRSVWEYAWPWIGVALAGLVVMAAIAALPGQLADPSVDVDTSSPPPTRPSSTTAAMSISTTSTVIPATTVAVAPSTAPQAKVLPTSSAPPPTTTAVPASGEPVYYENCSAVRAAGAAPVYAGQPGYGTHLDRDGDGIGCE
jgi:hypothetical protein